MMHTGPLLRPVIMVEIEIETGAKVAAESWQAQRTGTKHRARRARNTSVQTRTEGTAVYNRDVSYPTRKTGNDTGMNNAPNKTGPSQPFRLPVEERKDGGSVSKKRGRVG